MQVRRMMPLDAEPERCAGGLGRGRSRLRGFGKIALFAVLFEGHRRQGFEFTITCGALETEAPPVGH